MEIKILKLFQFNKENDNFELVKDFGGISSLLVSKDNTEGKTTILRSIIFALGFDVQSISEGYNKTWPILRINFKINEVIYSWKRDLKSPSLVYQSLPHKKTFNLNEEPDLLAQTLGFDDYKFMNDILGAFYIDQDFGWRTINHGRVHPSSRLKFNFPRLLSRINKNSFRNDDNIDSRINELNNKKNATQKLLSSFKLSNKKKITIEEKIILNKWSDLITKIKKYEIINKRKREVPNAITKFIKLINENEILNNVVSEEKIATLKNMQKYEVELSREEIDWNNKYLNSMKKQKLELEELISQQISFANNYENIEDAINNLINFNVIINKVSRDGLNFKLTEINNEISNLKKIKRDIYESNKKIFENLYNIIGKYIYDFVGVEIGVSSDIFMNWSQNKIFNNFSGAKKAFMVLLTRIIILKELYETRDIKLPFIIDTIVSFDPSDPSKNHLYNLLNAFNKSVSQLIIANVNKEVNNDLKKSLSLNEIIVEGSFKNKENNQISLDDIIY